ncbi:DUF4296 domain-containing protein [Sediminibacterium ginsengisoli]|uniref:DUF4296 domain-containing protein n=1 Tax=Sediminibacterium ginsengisoli TaxID=413434 RepID=A0A1T4RWK6_9BACT|nr:DUF4296 domain-containing protein [Sediminibacterium ginsengisoli]SKA19971.1 protein of unknown function [Sediminibacterium ginsengisoli]
MKRIAGAYISFFLAGMMMISCNSSAEKDILPVDSMKVVMWDMLKADEWYVHLTRKDSTLKKQREDIRLYEQVFLIHGITREQYYKSYRYYETHPVKFKQLLDSVDQLASREKQNWEHISR